MNLTRQDIEKNVAGRGKKSALMLRVAAMNAVVCKM